MAGAASAALGHVGNSQRLGVLPLHPLEHLLQPLRVPVLLRQRLRLCPGHQKEKAQHGGLDPQLIAVSPLTAQVLRIFQAGHGCGVYRLLRPQAYRQGQPSCRQGHQIPLGADIRRAGAEKFGVKDDVFILHGTAGHSTQRVQRPRRQEKDISLLRVHPAHPRLDLSSALLHIHQFHALVPVQCHRGKVLRDCAGINIKGKQYTAVLLRLLEIGRPRFAHRTSPFLSNRVK